MKNIEQKILEKLQDINRTLTCSLNAAPAEACCTEIGETSTTAYRGDRGKIAYDHSQSTGNPHGLSKADIGLSNVDNTSDNDKPISTAQQMAFDGKKNLAITAGAGIPLTFTTDKYYGTASSPITSNITFDLTGAKAGITAIVFHNSGTEPTYPIGTYKKGSWVYTPGQLNMLTFTYIDGSTILLDVQPTSSVGLQPEMLSWISKGGVATGFILSAMNQFLLDISSIRSKILRFNAIAGETFASAFIPLIVNADGNNTPLGGALDLNNNFTSGDFKNIGAAGGLKVTSWQTKYIDLNFNPSLISEFGLNDCGFGYYGKTDGYQTVMSVLDIGSANNIVMHTNSGQVAISQATSSNTIYASYFSVMAFNYATRLNSASFDMYCNGTKANYTATSTSKPNGNFRYGVFSSGQSANLLNMMPYVLTKGLNTSEEAILRSAIVSLISKLGRI